MDVMEEKLALHRARPTPSFQQTQPRRRRGVLPLALVAALGFYYWYSTRPILCTFPASRLPMFHPMGDEQPVQAKEFSTQEQEMLAQIPLSESSQERAKAKIAAAAEAGAQESSGSVDLEAHIMSQCPDAQDCIQQMVIPAMEEVSPLVNFTLSFIGNVQDDDSVECKHGPIECLGNMLMLCAQNMYPDTPIISLGFANCLISDYTRLAERNFVQDCALQHAVDFDDLNNCASEDERGGRLLRESVAWSKDQGVVYSCTVRVNAETWCVRDDGEWKQCAGGSAPGNLVERIRTLADGNTNT